MMDPHQPHFIRDFERFSLSSTIDEVRRRLNATHHREALRYGLVFDEFDNLLALIHSSHIINWPDQNTLALQRHRLPELYTLPEVEAMNHLDVAHFFEPDLNAHPNLAGIVLTDKAGQPTAILSRRELLDMMRLSETLTRGSDGAALASHKALQVTRYGHILFPAKVSLNTPYQLSIRINRHPSANASGQVDLGLTRGDWPIKVVATLVGVQPNDFRVAGMLRRVIEVERMADSQPALFTLIPQSLGEKYINIRFEQIEKQKVNYLVTTSLKTQVVATPVEDVANAAIEHMPVLATISDAPDLTIYINRTGGQHYQICAYRAESDPLAEAIPVIDEIEFLQPPEEYMKYIFAPLDERIEDGLSSHEYNQELRKIGNNLYEDLFHESGFKSFYWDYMSKMPDGATVQIVSEEPYIPWELLCPFRQDANGQWPTDGYLCERFALTRWLDGPQQANSLLLRTMVLIAPRSDLRWVENEIDELQNIPDVVIDPTEPIQDRRTLETFFRTKQANILHFACHGAYRTGNSGASWLQLQDANLYPSDIIAENRYFASIHPLVFLNACDSGRQGIGLTGLDGWAKKFLDAGVGFFIGSMWKTNDQLAYEFARVFYQRLQEGQSIAEAVRQARLAIGKVGTRISDSTHLSYTVYAHPCARVYSI